MNCLFSFDNQVGRCETSFNVDKKFGTNGIYVLIFKQFKWLTVYISTFNSLIFQAVMTLRLLVKSIDHTLETLIWYDICQFHRKIDSYLCTC